jgi:hypothetical protein
MWQSKCPKILNCLVIWERQNKTIKRAVKFRVGVDWSGASQRSLNRGCKKAVSNGYTEL